MRLRRVLCGRFTPCQLMRESSFVRGRRRRSQVAGVRRVRSRRVRIRGGRSRHPRRERAALRFGQSSDDLVERELSVFRRRQRSARLWALFAKGTTPPPEVLRRLVHSVPPGGREPALRETAACECLPRKVARSMRGVYSGQPILRSDPLASPAASASGKTLPLASERV